MNPDCILMSVVIGLSDSFAAEITARQRPVRLLSCSGGGAFCTAGSDPGQPSRWCFGHVLKNLLQHAPGAIQDSWRFEAEESARLAQRGRQTAGGGAGSGQPRRCAPLKGHLRAQVFVKGLYVGLLTCFRHVYRVWQPATGHSVD